MESRLLAAFLAVVEHRSLRKAARGLGRGPSALSRQIAALEHEVGRPLFHRVANGVEPTLAARELIDFARRRLSDEAAFRARLDRLTNPQSGEIRMMCGRGFLADLMAGALQGYCAAHPDVRFDIRTGSSQEMIEALRHKRTDLALVFNPGTADGILSVISRRRPLRLFVARDHPLAAREAVRLADVAGYPAALLAEESGIHALVRHVETATGCSINAHTITNSIDLLRRFARSGMGVTYLPDFCIDPDEADIVTVRLTDPPFRNAQASILTPDRPDIPPLVNALLSHLSSQMTAFR